jgi:hypothetical protein
MNVFNNIINQLQFLQNSTYNTPLIRSNLFETFIANQFVSNVYINDFINVPIQTEYKTNENDNTAPPVIKTIPG